MIRVSRRPLGILVTALVLMSGLMTGCRGKGRTIVTDTTIITTQSASPGVTTTPTPTLPDQTSVKEIDKPCPYISNDDWRNGEGNRVGRSVQLATKPVGCRFYFEYNPTESRGEILVYRFATSTEAYNAMVTAAKGHPEFIDDKTIGDGSISRRTIFDGGPAWECVYAKGTLVVRVRTSQPNTSENARSLAADLVPVIK